MNGMNALMPGEHDWLDKAKPSTPSVSPEPQKKSGLMNALGAVFKYGAPEAYEQGRQRKIQDQAGNALAMGDYRGAAEMMLRGGNLDGGLQLMQYADSQQAAGAEQEAAMRQQQAQGTLSLFSQMEPDQITNFALEQPQEFERITGMSSDEYMQAGAQMRQGGMDPAQFRQFVIQKAQAELGQMPEAAEQYTLAPGAERWQGDEMIASNPVEAEQWEDIPAPAGQQGYFQRNTQTGAVKRVAAPSSPMVTVNTGDMGPGQRPIVDKPPKGYQRIWDETEGTYRDKPIPGGEAARAEEEANTKAYQALRADEEQMGAIMDNIDAADELISNWTAGAGSLLDGIPATQARDLKARMETVRANIGFDKLNEMRQTSPTGGALGQVTERELNFLQSVRGSLDTGQSPDQLRQTLQEIKASLQRLQEVRQIAFQLQYAEPGQERPQIRTVDRPTNSDLPEGFEIVE